MSQLTETAATLKDIQRTLALNVLIEAYVAEYLPNGSSNAMMQIFRNAMSGETTKMTKAVASDRNKLLEAGDHESATESVSRRRSPPGTNKKFVDHRDTTTWVKDLLLYGMDHGGIIDLTKYRKERMPEIYGANFLASQTRLNPATGTLSRKNLARMIRPSYYELTTRGKEEAAQYASSMPLPAPGPTPPPPPMVEEIDEEEALPPASKSASGNRNHTPILNGNGKKSKDDKTAEAMIAFAAKQKHGELLLDEYYDEHYRLFGGSSPKEVSQLRARIIRVVNILIGDKKLREVDRRTGHFELWHMPKGTEHHV